MKQIHVFSLLFLLFLRSSNSESKLVDTDFNASSSVSRERKEDFVSLVKLIAAPEKYEGKTIQLVGYLNLEFEGNAIYLHQEDCEHNLTKNGFWVEFSEPVKKTRKLSDYSKKYVIIVGRFTTKEQGHMGLFGGEIKDISRLDRW